ncbi:MAG: hypothetical protein LBD42_09585 [Desulfovibrio sp.]|nr:hypothetical protein [Desulfovibrio sp.]
MIDKTMPHADIIRYVQERTPDGHILLSFSGGKDAWAAWLGIREHFDPAKITPFYYYLVPDLEFVEDYLTYAEGILGTRITRLPNPRFYEMLNDCVYQPPDRWPTILNLNLPRFTWDDVHRACEASRELPEKCWCAVGLRSADSVQRRTALRTHGVVNDKRRVFYPVWDWKIDRVYEELEHNRIKLPVDYNLFGRTFDGIYLLYLYNIKKHYPRDYERILEWFPLADLEIWRYERYGLCS